VGLAVLSLIGAVSAQGVPYPSLPGEGPIQQGGEIPKLFAKIAEWISTIFWIIAVVFILYAGISYMTAKGEQEAIKKANQRLLYGIIAIVVGILAYGLPKLIESILRGV